MLSQLFYVLAHSLVKMGHAWLSLSVLLMARFGVSAAVLFCIYALSGAWRRPSGKTGSNINLLVFRAVMGLSSMSCYFYALRIGPLGRGNLIFSLGVLWAYVFAVLLKHERPTTRSVLGMCTALLGLSLLFVVRGEGGNIYADLAALVGSLFAGLVMVTIKFLRREHSSRQIVTWFYGLGAVLLIPFVSLDGVVWSWPLVGLVLGIGIAGLLAQWMMTEAYKAVPGSVASSMNLLGTPMMMGSGMLFFAESFQGMEMLGAVCIMIGLVAIVWPRREL